MPHSVLNAARPSKVPATISLMALSDKMLNGQSSSDRVDMVSARDNVTHAGSPGKRLILAINRMANFNFKLKRIGRASQRVHCAQVAEPSEARVRDLRDRVAIEKSSGCCGWERTIAGCKRSQGPGRRQREAGSFFFAQTHMYAVPLRKLSCGNVV